MNERRVTSWSELHDALFAESWRPELRRFRSHEAFRGLADVRSVLDSGLHRMRHRDGSIERHLLRNFRKYAHRDVAPGDSVWHWISLAQHHGLPTRLLDWTFSPYVALHFVTANLARYDADGVVWAVDYVKTHELLPAPLRDLLHGEGADVFTVEMLAAALQSLPQLDAMAPPEFTLFFEPPSLDDRIVNQYALHSIMSGPGAVLSSWLELHPEVFRRLVIPAELKREIRDKLDQANITERVLFPGLDGLSTWLKRHYSP